MKLSRAGGSTVALAVVCAALLGICLEIIDDSTAPLDERPATSLVAQGLQPVNDMPAPLAALQSYSAIWLKPLFTPNRSPDPTSTRPAVNSSGLTLTGVVITANLRVAFFKRTDSTVVIGRENQSLPDGWKVTRINPRSVQTERGIEQLTLALPLPAAAAPLRSADPPFDLKAAPQ